MWFRGLAVAAILAMAAPAAAQDPSEVYLGRTVLAVRFEVEGRPNTPVPGETSLRELVDVRSGQPLRREDVRTSMDHLYALGRYEDVRPSVVGEPAGVVVVFRLVPRYPINRVEVFADNPAVPASALTTELRLRFVGRQPGAVRTEVVEDVVQRYLNDIGYLSPTVLASTVVAEDDDTAGLVVKVAAGPLAAIGTATVRNASPLTDAEVLSRAEALPGRPYRRRDIETRLTEIEDDLRSRGYYEAQASLEGTPAADGVAVNVNVQAGPRVELHVEPDGSLPGSIDALIPIERQRSVDQDLLEDAQANIEAALKREGYAKAAAPFTTEPSADGAVLVVTFRIDRGARHLVDRIDLPPALSVPEPVLRKLLGLAPGAVFDQDRYDAGVAAVRQEYLQRGYYKFDAKAAFQPVPALSTGSEARIALQPAITEGPRALVSAVTFAFEGPHQVPEAGLRQQMRSGTGAPYVALDARFDRERLLSYYRDRGFLSAAVGVDPRFNSDGTAVDLVFAINEGPQITIGRITVLGQERVSERQILEEMRLVPGQPMGLASLSTARQRLADMGIFRSFTLEAADRLSGETEGHVVVTVSEAPATTFGFGLGLEAGSRARQAEDGTALEDVIEVSPRGFFEIGRRHLGGRNRSVHLFTRVGLRRTSTEDVSGTFEDSEFTEYRVTGTFQERHAFRSDTDLLVGYTSEQAVRPTYNYLRHAVNAEFLRRLGRRASVSGRYALDRTRLFDERIPEQDQPLIDRLFPQVRLSILSSGLAWDGRDNPLTPTRGTFLSADGEWAVRALGSEVGYVKGFFQASGFRPLDASRSTVLALRGQLGVAHGLLREIEATTIDPEGTVRDLPASQRFYAGGGTTVRGFPVDRLGVFDPDCVRCSVLNPTTGLSIGGNAVVVLNAELRRRLTNINRNLAVVTFVDGGQVFPAVTDLDLTRIRGTAGFGVRYDSPLGPLRLDLGFKMNRLIIGGRPESAWEYHLSIGEVF